MAVFEHYPPVLGQQPDGGCLALSSPPAPSFLGTRDRAAPPSSASLHLGRSTPQRHSLCRTCTGCPSLSRPLAGSLHFFIEIIRKKCMYFAPSTPVFPAKWGVFAVYHLANQYGHSGQEEDPR